MYGKTNDWHDRMSVIPVVLRWLFRDKQPPGSVKLHSVKRTMKK